MTVDGLAATDPSDVSVFVATRDPASLESSVDTGWREDQSVSVTRL